MSSNLSFLVCHFHQEELLGGLLAQINCIGAESIPVFIKDASCTLSPSCLAALYSNIAFTILSCQDSNVYQGFNELIPLVQTTHYLPMGCDDRLLDNTESLRLLLDGQIVLDNCTYYCLPVLVDGNIKHPSLDFALWYRGPNHVNSSHSGANLIPVTFHQNVGFYEYKSQPILADSLFFYKCFKRELKFEKLSFPLACFSSTCISSQSSFRTALCLLRLGLMTHPFRSLLVFLLRIMRWSNA
jgi:hypothetical protein